MIQIYWIFESRDCHGYATLETTLRHVPRVGEYIVAPGCGALGLPVHSVIHYAIVTNGVTVTVQVRGGGPWNDEQRQSMRDAGWIFYS